MEHAALAVGRRAHAGAPVELLVGVVLAADVPSLDAPDGVAGLRSGVISHEPEHH